MDGELSPGDPWCQLQSFSGMEEHGCVHDLRGALIKRSECKIRELILKEVQSAGKCVYLVLKTMEKSVFWICAAALVPRGDASGVQILI